MAELMPWDELAMVFVASPTAPTLNGQGRPTFDLRLVMGALLVQQIEGLSDERTLELINENVYVQFFCGLPGFQVTPLFDSSSMTHWRSWLGDSGAAALSETLADIFEQRRKEDLKSNNENGEDDDDLNDPTFVSQDKSSKSEETNDCGHENLKPNQGTLLLDAT